MLIHRIGSPILIPMIMFIKRTAVHITFEKPERTPAKELLVSLVSMWTKHFVVIHTLHVFYAHTAAKLNLQYSKFVKVAHVYHFCTIHMRNGTLKPNIGPMFGNLCQTLAQYWPNVWHKQVSRLGISECYYAWPTSTSFAGLSLVHLKSLYFAKCKQRRAFAQCKSATLCQTLDLVLNTHEFWPGQKKN